MEAPLPHVWTDTPEGAVLRAWPHRSLPGRGFVWVIALTAVGLGLPLAAVVGTAILWGLLPFAVAVVWALWAALARTNRSAAITETLALAPASLTLTRSEPGRADRIWRANPYWVRVALRDGPVPDYLTLAAEGQEKELGAFLSVDERRSLAREVRQRLAALSEDRT